MNPPRPNATLPKPPVVKELDASILLDYYVKLAKRWFEDGKGDYIAGALKSAWEKLMRFVILVLERIPTHPKYRSRELKTHMVELKVLADESLQYLEAMKVDVLAAEQRRLDREYDQKYPRQPRSNRKSRKGDKNSASRGDSKGADSNAPSPSKEGLDVPPNFPPASTNDVQPFLSSSGAESMFPGAPGGGLDVQPFLSSSGAESMFPGAPGGGLDVPPNASVSVPASIEEQFVAQPSEGAFEAPQDENRVRSLDRQVSRARMQSIKRLHRIQTDRQDDDIVSFKPQSRVQLGALLEVSMPAEIVQKGKDIENVGRGAERRVSEFEFTPDDVTSSDGMRPHPSWMDRPLDFVLSAYPGANEQFQPNGLLSPGRDRVAREIQPYQRMKMEGRFPEQMSRQTVVCPDALIRSFVDYCQWDLGSDVETNGVLCGYKATDENFVQYVVSLLIIPEQDGSSISTEARNDIQVSQIVSQRGLQMIGWIHSHPQHSAFLSSVDLHTHWSIQMSFSSAIAIVVSPWFSPSVGVFRITDGGMLHLKNCKRTDVHEHKVSFPLFHDCDGDDGHVKWVEEGSLDVVDLRSSDLRPLSDL